MERSALVRKGSSFQNAASALDLVIMVSCVRIHIMECSLNADSIFLNYLVIMSANRLNRYKFNAKNQKFAIMHNSSCLFSFKYQM